MAAGPERGSGSQKDMETMITAGEARRISEANRNNALSEEMEMAGRKIEDSIADGKMEAVVFKELSKEVADRLRNLGYKVEKRNAEYNDIDTVISWGDREE